MNILPTTLIQPGSTHHDSVVISCQYGNLSFRNQLCLEQIAKPHDTVATLKEKVDRLAEELAQRVQRFAEGLERARSWSGIAHLGQEKIPVYITKVDTARFSIAWQYTWDGQHGEGAKSFDAGTDSMLNWVSSDGLTPFAQEEIKRFVREKIEHEEHKALLPHDAIAQYRSSLHTAPGPEGWTQMYLPPCGPPTHYPSPHGYGLPYAFIPPPGLGYPPNPMPSALEPSPAQSTPQDSAQ